MMEEDEETSLIICRTKSDLPARRRPKRIRIPRRALSVAIPEPKIMVMTAGIKPVPIKLRQCLISPLTLYELSAAVVDGLDYPDAFKWTETDVAKWMVNVVGLPQYRVRFTDRAKHNISFCT
ncbi:hypothetical protein B5X24_HaOG208513 [Helicoverpa armigera]|uniref:SAM domain-containing protein n=1 Tax=Helicoverpa armigera TaxID=29058 RepID=A0A2W1BI35_HELAM|nr:hypothetical protein B5X24_HaOG208513 [Helicoverpa armigera]